MESATSLTHLSQNSHVRVITFHQKAEVAAQPLHKKRVTELLKFASSFLLVIQPQKDEELAESSEGSEGRGPSG